MTRPEAGIPIEVARALKSYRPRMLAFMTHWGTNCYHVGVSDLAVVDPGPADPAHISGLLRAVGSRTVSHILVTHSHKDHSGATAHLSARTGAPFVGFGPAHTWRRRAIKKLADAGDL